MPGAIASQLIGKVSLEGAEKTKSDLETIGKKTDETKEHFRGLKDALSTAAGFAIFGGISAGFGFLKDQFGDVIKLAMDHQQVEAQLAARLHDTAGAVGMNINALEDYADKLSKVTPFAKDTILQGDEMLLTFKSIGKDVFPQATHAMVELSQVMGGDMQGAAVMLGKAMDDPVQGIMALHRVGVSFDEKTKELIKTYMAHGQAAKAQTLILQELAGQGFNTAAEAAGKTFGGQLAILSHNFDEMKIKIGTALLPVLNDLLNKYVVPLANKFSDWMTKGGGLQDFQNWIKTTVNFFEGQFLPDLNKLLNQYIIPLATNFYDVFIKSGLLQTVWQDTTGVLGTLLPQVGALLLDLGNFAEWLSKDTPGADALKVALIGIGIAIAGFKGAQGLVDLNNKIGDIIGSASKMKQTFMDFLNWFGSQFGTNAKKTIDDVGDSANTAGGKIQDMGTKAQVSSGEVSGLGTASETSAGQETLAGDDAEIAGGKIAVMGTESGVAAGASGLGALTGAVGALFNLVGPAIGIALLGEQLNIAIGMIEAGPQNSATVTGKAKHYRGPHSFASGVTNFEGGLAYVHQGEMLVNMPRGTDVIPSNMVNSYAGTPGNSTQPLILQIDGVQFARVVMPYLTDRIRYSVGSTGW